MSNRKNYNSILFLTVYLGLVLVRATPQVMAYAATNSLYELRNEIEFKDDLDNQPDDSCLDLKVKTDKQDNQFITEYINLVSALSKRYLPDIQLNMSGGVVDAEAFPSLSKDLTIDFSFLKFDKEGILVKLNLDVLTKTKKANSFALAFNQILSFEAHKSQNLPERVIAENTKITFKNNQILIVTNLPRASIDSLLKQPAVSRQQ